MWLSDASSSGMGKAAAAYSERNWRSLERGECYISRSDGDSDGDDLTASRGTRGDDRVSIDFKNFTMAPSKDESKFGAVAKHLCLRELTFCS